MRILFAFGLLQTSALADAETEIEALRKFAPKRPEVPMLEAFRQLQTGDVAGARKTVSEVLHDYPGVQLPPQLDALSRAP